ncbi:hypothetical protein DRW71_13205 [Salmonella enterica subsp. diarizonae]|nr:hypothetical protein [Salmonella enterica subsp. diarizonae]
MLYESHFPPLLPPTADQGICFVKRQRLCIDTRRGAPTWNGKQKDLLQSDVTLPICCMSCAVKLTENKISGD